MSDEVKEPTLEEIKAAVWKAYPKAYAECRWDQSWKVYSGERGNKHLGEKRLTHDEAWADAYSKLTPPQHTTPTHLHISGDATCELKYAPPAPPIEDFDPEKVTRFKFGPMHTYVDARDYDRLLASRKAISASDEDALAIFFGAELLPGRGCKAYPPPSEEGKSPARNVHCLWRAALNLLAARKASASADWSAEKEADKLRAAEVALQSANQADMQRNMESALREPLAASAPHTGKWIPATERLPEIGHRVHVLFNGDIPQAFLKKSISGFLWWETEEGNALEPTHWREHPAPPTQKEKV